MHREGKLFLRGNYKTMPKYHPRPNGQRLQTSRNIENKTEKQFFSRFGFRQTTKPFCLKDYSLRRKKTRILKFKYSNNSLFDKNNCFLFKHLYASELNHLVFVIKTKNVTTHFLSITFVLQKMVKNVPFNFKSQPICNS